MALFGKKTQTQETDARVNDISPSKVEKPEMPVNPYFLQEQEWTYRIHDRLLKVIDLSLIGELENERARKEIRDVANRLINEESVPLPASSRQRVVRQVEDEVMGLGPLEPLLADNSVADILVNGFGQVYVERAGKLRETPIRFRDDSHLMNIIDRIVSSVGRRIDESSPMVDARLKDGSRVNAIVPPLAIDGPSLSIRRFAIERPSAQDLVDIGSLTPVLVEVLKGIVKSRLNVLISGGTGSGKTTLLNVLSGFIPPDERIVTIEDSAELQLQQPHVVRLETRPPNIEHKGEVTQRDLVRNSLRMRPDRIIVGEVRAAEALDMLQAMNTGHDGSLTTVHANSPRDSLSRLETMVMMAGLNMPIKAMRNQIASAIDIVIQLQRLEDGKRRLVSLQEIQGMEGDIITMTELFKFERRGVDEQGNVVGHLHATGLVPSFHEHLRQRGIDLDISVFSPNN
jgi:pilus assembly protein CpaF